MAGKVESHKPLRSLKKIQIFTGANSLKDDGLADMPSCGATSTKAGIAIQTSRLNPIRNMVALVSA